MLLTDDLDLLDAEMLGGEPGDAYLAAHPEIPRSANGRPLRGMLLPASPEEAAAYKAEFGKAAPAAAYQGPSYAELKKRGQDLTEAERYWIASVEGDKAAVRALYASLTADIDAQIAAVKARLAYAEGRRRGIDEGLDAGEGGWDPFGKLFKGMSTYVKVGAAVVIASAGVGVAVGIKRMFS